MRRTDAERATRLAFGIGEQEVGKVEPPDPVAVRFYRIPRHARDGDSVFPILGMVYAKLAQLRSHPGVLLRM